MTSGASLARADQFLGAGTEVFRKLARVLQDVEHQADAIPDAFDRFPTAFKDAVADRHGGARGGHVRPLRFEAGPFLAQETFQVDRSGRHRI